MINKVIKEYLEHENNIDTNYEAIFSKIEGEKNMNNWKRKVLNGVAAVIGIVIIGTVSNQIYAKIKLEAEFKEYQNREYKYGVGQKDLTESIDMQYIEQDGIKVKVDSLMTTDDRLEAKINFEFAEGIEVNSETFEFGYAIYDENNNLYGLYGNMNNKMAKKGYNYHARNIYKELGINAKKYIPLIKSTGISRLSSQNRNIVSKIIMNSHSGFPNAKKLYIRIFDLEYHLDYYKTEEIKTAPTIEYFPISDAEWIFEINVPESIYNRTTTNLKLKQEIPELEITHIKVTETGLILKGKMEELYNAMMSGKDMKPEEWTIKHDEIINITDNQGNSYYYKSSGSTGEKNGFTFNFEIDQDMVKNSQFFLNINVNGKQYSSELVVE